MEAFVTGTTIKKLREEKRITQGELAQMIGVSDKAVSKWETGRGLPDISLLEPFPGRWASRWRNCLQVST